MARRSMPRANSKYDSGDSSGVVRGVRMRKVLAVSIALVASLLTLYVGFYSGTDGGADSSSSSSAGADIASLPGVDPSSQRDGGGDANAVDKQHGGDGGDGGGGGGGLFGHGAGIAGSIAHMNHKQHVNHKGNNNANAGGDNDNATGDNGHHNTAPGGGARRKEAIAKFNAKLELKKLGAEAQAALKEKQELAAHNATAAADPMATVTHGGRGEKPTVAPTHTVAPLETLLDANSALPVSMSTPNRMYSVVDYRFAGPPFAVTQQGGMLHTLHEYVTKIDAREARYNRATFTTDPAARVYKRVPHVVTQAHDTSEFPAVPARFERGSVPCEFSATAGADDGEVVAEFERAFSVQLGDVMTVVPEMVYDPLTPARWSTVTMVMVTGYEHSGTQYLTATHHVCCDTMWRFNAISFHVDEPPQCGISAADWPKATTVMQNFFRALREETWFHGQPARPADEEGVANLQRHWRNVIVFLEEHAPHVHTVVFHVSFPTLAKHYRPYLPDLARVFPSYRVLVSLRNPIAVVDSHMRALSDDELQDSFVRAQYIADERRRTIEGLTSLAGGVEALEPQCAAVVSLETSDARPDDVRAALANFEEQPAACYVPFSTPVSPKPWMLTKTETKAVKTALEARVFQFDALASRAEAFLPSVPPTDAAQ